MDKLRTTFPIAVTFYDGESPSADKLNGVSKQARNGLSIVEYAIGDLWNQSGDAILANDLDARLMIPNVGRYLGSPKYLNPYIPNLQVGNSQVFYYTHKFTNEDDLHTARLPFPVLTTSTFTWTGTSRPSREADIEDVDSTGKWYLDYTTGDIYAYDAFDVNDYLRYQPAYDSSGTEVRGVYGDLGENKTFNIIPDPNTDSYLFGGVKIENKSTDEYYIFLPPRGPLRTTRSVDGSPENIPENFSAPGATFTFWMDDSSTAPTDDSNGASHYRYKLPSLITDNQVAGGMFPTGMLYLYDQNNTGTIIDGLSYYAHPTTPNGYTLVVKGANLTTWLNTTGASIYTAAILASPTHVSDNYPQTGLRLITVGTNLSEAFSSLLSQFLNHDHSSAGSLVSRSVSHSKLDGLFDPGSADPLFSPSGLTNDDHPQYLHRRGYSTTRDSVHGGAMLGDLVLASITALSSDYLNTSYRSNKLSFGNVYPAGPSIYWDTTRLMVDIHSALSPGVTRFQCGSNTLDLSIASTNTITSSTTLDITCDSSAPIRLNNDTFLYGAFVGTNTSFYGIANYQTHATGASILGRNTSSGTGVKGESLGSGIGVKGTSTNGVGVVGSTFEHVNYQYVVIEIPLKPTYIYNFNLFDASGNYYLEAENVGSASLRILFNDIPFDSYIRNIGVSYGTSGSSDISTTFTVYRRRATFTATTSNDPTTLLTNGPAYNITTLINAASLPYNKTWYVNSILHYATPSIVKTDSYVSKSDILYFKLDTIISTPVAGEKIDIYGIYLFLEAASVAKFSGFASASHLTTNYGF